MAGKTLNNYARRAAEIESPEVETGTWETSGSAPTEAPAPTFSDPIPFESMDFMEQAQEAMQPEPQQQEPVQQYEPQEQEEPQEQPQENTPQYTKKGPSAAENMRVIREAKEKAERERDELMRMYQMQQMQQQMQQQQQFKQPEPEPEIEFEVPELDLDLDDDGLAENRHLKAMHKQMVAMQKQIKMQKQEAVRIQQKTQESMIETRIKATYPDFDSVVSQENIATFSKMYPEIAQTLHTTPDLYNKAVSAYTLIKQFGIGRERTTSQDAARAINNINKPRPLSSIAPTRGQDSASPLTRANGFANADSSAAARKAAYNEMIEAARGL